MASHQFLPFKSGHNDFVHDVAYDYYGKRLASCSSDRRIKVWGQGEDGEWEEQSDWEAHRGSVWKLAWAHPEFGQVIASCSFDRTVGIWEEQEKSGGKSTWSKKAELADSRDSVHDLKFAPKHAGLQLATASADGFVRIYEAQDVMNLSQWQLKDEFQAGTYGATCLSWCQSRFNNPMLVVGTAKEEEEGVCAKVWENDGRQWKVAVQLQGHKQEVHDVCWAPDLGRSFHLIATASKDKTLRIWRIEDGDTVAGQVQEVAKKTEHDSEVWRVEWNITGSVLASSGDDGTVRLWRCTNEGKWDCISEICGGEH
jgi:nucleoporin SEH1